MKILSFVLLSFILLGSISAQTSSEPLRFDRNFLVHSAGLPEEFLLFVPDSASQIFFNPARANNFTTNFVYANYLSDYVRPYYYTYGYVFESPVNIDIISPSLGKGTVYTTPSVAEESYSYSRNPTFSLAALLNDESGKWLFSVSNGLYDAENNISQAREQRNLSDYGDEFTTNEQRLDRSYNDLLTTIKASRIWKTEAVNFSFGVFAVIYNDSDELMQNTFTGNNRTYREYPSGNIIQRNEYTSSVGEKTVIKNKKFAAGLEFTANGEKWDFVSSLNYQKNNVEQVIDRTAGSYRYDSVFYYDTQTWNVSSNYNNNTRTGSIESAPDVFSINSYYQHSISWLTPDDNIFLSLNGFISDGDIDYSGSYSESYGSFSSTGSPYSSNTGSRQNGTIEAKSWGVHISTGYALSAALSDIYFLSGLKLSGSHTDIEDVTPNLTSSQSSFLENNTRITTAGLTFPLYISYTPAKWVSVYGGLNYSYYYDKNNSESTLQLINYYPPGSSYTNENRTDKTSSWRSSKSIYLGCELRHDSGLKLQFFFDEDFTSIREWNVSVGYHF